MVARHPRRASPGERDGAPERGPTTKGRRRVRGPGAGGVARGGASAFGAAPGRARARRFAGDSREIRRWLRGYALGLVLLRQQSGTAAAVFAPLFDAERIRLFRVVEIGRGE